MKIRKLCLRHLHLLFVFVFFMTTTVNAQEKESLKLGVEAYIYGYPLVTLDMTKRIMTNVATPDGLKSPINQFAHQREYSDAAPNIGTLYSLAWLDLTKEPLILHIPEMNNRYYVMQIINAWSDTVTSLGKRTTGTYAQEYAITGPEWQGKLPKNVTQIKSPTNIVWIIGRTYCLGTQEDYKITHALQNGYTLIPLSFYGKTYTPPQGIVDTTIDMKTPIEDQVNAMDGITYFKKLSELLKNNLPTAADASLVKKLADIGIISGKDFNSIVDPKLLTKAVEIAQEKIFNPDGVDSYKDGWSQTLKTGSYGTHYLQRAFLTASYLGANFPQDEVYPVAETDMDGEKLNGANRYLLHFAENQIPPVVAFWSLTAYNNQHDWLNNPQQNVLLSVRDNLQLNQDGSLDIYIQHNSPGKDKEANWLPTPEGEFNLGLHLYWPLQVVLNDSWRAPGVRKYQ